MAAEQLGEGSRRPGNGAAPTNGGTNGGNAGSTISDIGDSIGAQADQQKARAADRVGRAADAVRDAARGMHGQEDWMAGLVERGADELARMAETLRTSDFRTLLNQAEDFARRQPVLFAGAGAVLGFALTRAARAGIAATARGTADRWDQATPRRQETDADWGTDRPGAAPFARNGENRDD